MSFAPSIFNAGGPLDQPVAHAIHGGYGRLFRDLHYRPWEPRGASEAAREQRLREIAEGLFGRGERNDNPDIPAAYTYFGQLLNHDITLDGRSSLVERTDPAQVPNFRTPRFDLDSVYGRGPLHSPHLYESANPDKLLVGRNEFGELDLPRNRDASSDRFSTNHVNRMRRALVGDARDDQNLLVSQLHLAVLRFHNRRVDEGASFLEAQRLTRWHYQWVVIHDFLPLLCGRELVHDLLGKRGEPRLRYFRPQDRLYMPVEFSFGAFRAGHGMVRDSYELNDAQSEARKGVPFQILGGLSPEHHLEGGRELPRDWSVQWDRFLEHEGSRPQRSMLIGPSLARPLQSIPVPEAEPHASSLAYRTLRRSWNLRLPSGQRVAEYLGARHVVPAENPEEQDPLWIYVLREAEQLQGGRRLGTVGARIVAEVCVGLLTADPTSFYRHGWEPELSSVDGHFRLRDFLIHAGALDGHAPGNGAGAPVGGGTSPAAPAARAASARRGTSGKKTTRKKTARKKPTRKKTTRKKATRKKTVRKKTARGSGPAAAKKAVRKKSVRKKATKSGARKQATRRKTRKR